MTDTRLIHTVGAGALEWLWAHRDGFRLEPDVDPEVGFLERFKPVGELALICSVLFREGVAGSRQAELARRLIDHAWRDTLDGGRMLVRGQRTEPISPFRSRSICPSVNSVTASPRWNGPSCSTTASTAGRPSRRAPTAGWPSPRSSAASGSAPALRVRGAACHLAGPHPEPWTVEGHIAYDITHCVFHLTDWGENPDGLPPDIADYLATWLPAWIDDWLDLRRWDLLGELLVVDACLPRPTLDEPAWRAFAAAQQPDGAMPAIRTMPEGDEEAVFDIVYHSTLVAAFASVLATSRALTALARAS